MSFRTGARASVRKARQLVGSRLRPAPIHNERRCSAGSRAARLGDGARCRDLRSLSLRRRRLAYRLGRLCVLCDRRSGAIRNGSPPVEAHGGCAMALCGAAARHARLGRVGSRPRLLVPCAARRHSCAARRLASPAVGDADPRAARAAGGLCARRGDRALRRGSRLVAIIRSARNSGRVGGGRRRPRRRAEAAAGADWTAYGANGLRRPLLLPCANHARQCRQA